MDKIIDLDELVLNYFITESCNYKCSFCYSHWEYDKTNELKEYNFESQKKLLAALFEYFQPSSRHNLLAKKVKWKFARINISGGEPLIVKHIDDLIGYAHSIGFKVSLITNGSLLNRKLIRKIIPFLDNFGLSIDACEPEVNRSLGRVDRLGNVLTLSDLRSHIDYIKKINPSIKLKVNSVVTKDNMNCDLSPMIKIIRPEKWSALQMAPVLNKEGTVSKKQYLDFINHHKKLGVIPEDNDVFINSWILITPDGRFFSNGDALESGGNYKYSDKILEVGVDKAFRQIDFDLDNYMRKYFMSFLSKVYKD